MQKPSVGALATGACGVRHHRNGLAAALPAPDQAILLQLVEQELIPLHQGETTRLHQDVIALHDHFVAALDTARRRIVGVDFHVVVGPALRDVGLSGVVIGRLPKLVDAPVGHP